MCFPSSLGKYFSTGQLDLYIHSSYLFPLCLAEMPMKTEIFVGEGRGKSIVYCWPAYDSTLPTIGDAVHRVERLGYKISKYPTCRITQISLPEEDPLFVTIAYRIYHHYPNMYDLCRCEKR